jgi:hypothetical protein
MPGNARIFEDAALVFENERINVRVFATTRPVNIHVLAQDEFAGERITTRR